MASINKRQLSQFRQWQQDSSRHIAQPSDEKHHCQCCDTDFTGNFCPQCGQKAGVGRVTWESVRQGFTMLWGMDTRSLPYTLWQLLLRPGYLIGDYISGKRQVSFPPVNMLALVALFVFLIIEDTSEEPGDTIGEYYFLFNHILTYIETHYDAAFLFYFSMLIVPTYFTFRFAPRHPRHNLPEGVFIAVFNSTIGLLVLLVVGVLWEIVGNGNIEDLGLPLLLAVMLLAYRSFHQLFGYGYWGTLWRTMIVFFAGGSMMGVLLLTDNIISLMIVGKCDMALHRFIVRFIPYLLGVVITLAATYFISRRTAGRRICEEG